MLRPDTLIGAVQRYQIDRALRKQCVKLALHEHAAILIRKPALLCWQDIPCDALPNSLRFGPGYLMTQGSGCAAAARAAAGEQPAAGDPAGLPRRLRSGHLGARAVCAGRRRFAPLPPESHDGRRCFGCARIAWLPASVQQHPRPVLDTRWMRSCTLLELMCCGKTARLKLSS